MFIVYLRPYQVHPVFRSQRYMQMSNCFGHILYYRRLSLGKFGHSWFDNQDIHALEKNRKIVHSKIIFKKILHLKGQLISKGLFGFFNSPKKRTKNFCPSRLGLKIYIFKFIFFGELKALKFPFEIN